MLTRNAILRIDQSPKSWAALRRTIPVYRPWPCAARRLGYIGIRFYELLEHEAVADIEARYRKPNT